MSTSASPPPVSPGLRWSGAGVFAVVLAWAVAKYVSAWWWVWRPEEFSDTYYYFLAAEAAVATGELAQALPEYPTPAGWLLLAPYLLGAHDYVAYRGAVMAMTTVADAAFALVLGRVAGPIGVLGWIGLTTALGSLPLLRFDMLPAAAAGIALLLIVQRRGSGAAVMVALGTGLKVWPIVLAPLILAGRRRAAAVVTFVASGLTLVLGSVLVGGWDRLLSPLTHQRERGLQIEAVAALVPMWSWSRGGDQTIGYSEFHAYEVAGAGVDGWLLAAQAAALVAALACGVLLLVWLFRGADVGAAAWLALGLVGAFIVTSPALSPQYLVWLAPPAAVLLGTADRQDAGAPSWPRAAATWAAALALCVLTTVIYPVAYDALLQHRPTTTAALTVLTARNLGLVVLVVGCLEAAWGAVGGNPRKPVRGNRPRSLELAGRRFRTEEDADGDAGRDD